MTATLRALSDHISAAVHDIERICASKSFEFPSLDDPFTLESERPRFDPDILKSASVIIAAASQLVASVREPSVTLITTACGFHLSSALQTALITNTVECLRPHGETGLHVTQLADSVKMDEKKLGRILRLLCTYHIFREVRPDVFANNRLSSSLDTGRHFNEVHRGGDSRHDRTSGLGALIEHFTDEIYKGSAHMADHLIDPSTAWSDSPTCTPLNRAFGHDMDVFSWFERPENKYRLKRFGVAMHATESVQPTGAILNGFPWNTLPADDLIVDVGGGIGASTMDLYTAHPALRYVVQDRPGVLSDSTKFWSDRQPEALQSGRVQLQGHDFMQPQPVKNASLFILRKVLHNLSDTLAIEVLHHLRQAATQSTQLLIIDHLVPYACLDTSHNRDIPGAALPLAPDPLLANMGQASALTYITDIQMLVALNAQERTLGQFVDLLEKSGWELVHIYGSETFAMKYLVAAPMVSR